MEKFTKGEWVVKPNERNPENMQVWYPHGFLTSAGVIPVSQERLSGESWFDCQERTKPQREKAKDESNANMHLIAAAPEMYELLDSIENDNEQVPEWMFARIQLVLAKARGE